jgi:plasmid stabilization system protein ParE
MTSYKVIMMPNATKNLVEIGRYIALDNPMRAISFVDEIKKSLQNNLSMFPYLCRVVEDLDFDEEVRIFSYGNYNCYYLVNEEKVSVEVLFVFNASRDVNLHM